MQSIFYPYHSPHIIGISNFYLSVLSYNRPEGTEKKEKEGAENAEGVLRKLLSPRGEMTKQTRNNTAQKEGAGNAEGVL